jgi:hypothetical protein
MSYEGEASDVGRLKAFWLILLAATTVAVLSAGTLAAYNQKIDMTCAIRAAQMVFKVNGGGEETQPLGDFDLKPGDSKICPITIVTEGTEVALNVALKVNASGCDLPQGVLVKVDGEQIDPCAGSRTITYPGMNGDSHTVSVEVLWNATMDELAKCYKESKNFKLNLSATVTATQANS